MKLPYWLVIFLFMCNVGALAWIVRAGPQEHYFAFVLAVAFMVALPHVPRSPP